VTPYRDVDDGVKLHSTMNGLFALNRKFVISRQPPWNVTSLVCSRKRYKVSIWVNLCPLTTNKYKTNSDL